MAKPRRKHLTVRTIEESAAGRAFLAELHEAVGDGAAYHPRAYDEGWHYFSVRGALGEAFVRDRQERAHNGCWVAQTEMIQLRWTIDGSGAWRVTLTTHRPDGAIGWSGPPAGLTKAAQRRWWGTERARVGDELDTIERAFIPDDDPVPLVLDDAQLLARLFGCSMCDQPAARLAHAPAGCELPWWPMPQDLARARLFVDLGGPMNVWTAGIDDDELFEDAREALGVTDIPRLAELDERWAPFWCRDCERTYCLAHWDTENRCPHGHARAGSTNLRA